MNKSNPSGTIRYTGRAFHQDASVAMKGDIVRAIIELVTNSDDSYASLDDSSKQKIMIEVEHRRSQPWQVVVRDRAAGMSAQTMIDRLTTLGGRTSGFESGKKRRGNLGRGAKDVAAFGDVSFKSIKDGSYSELLLRRSGDWSVIANRHCTPQDRKTLGVRRGNGTVVEIEALPSVRCPRHSTLKRRLSTHYQLRDILSDPNRRVELVNINDGTRDLLLYQYPDGEIVHESILDIEGYDAAEPSLMIRRLKKRCEEGAYDPGRACGILIKGSRAIYDNTLFKFEHNIHASWFTGELSCPHIDQLAREYDDLLEKGQTHPASNPVPIITRHRDGLNDSHPFVHALYTAAEARLGELVAEEEERAGSATDLESQRTKADLGRLAREASRLINEELKDIEAEELPISDSGEPPLLSIVPEVAYAYLNEDRTLTVAAHAQGVSVGDTVDVSLDPEGVLELLSQEVKLSPHRRREDILVGQIQLRPLLVNESTLVSARMNGRTADAIVQVRPPREVVEVEVEPPETFMFERSSYRIGYGRGKDVKLVAPAAVVADHGHSVLASSSDPGVVVKTPSTDLTYDESLDYYTAKVRVQARTLHAAAELTAKLDGLVDTAQVKVTRKEESPGMNIKLEDESFGIWRALLDRETTEQGREISVIKIAGRHPALRRVLGDEWERQHAPTCRLLLAEIVADVASRHIVQELYRMRRTTEEFDSDRLYREHYKRMKRFLPRFQKVLVPSSDLRPPE